MSHGKRDEASVNCVVGGEVAGKLSMCEEIGLFVEGSKMEVWFGVRMMSYAIVG